MATRRRTAKATVTATNAQNSNGGDWAAVLPMVEVTESMMPAEKFATSETALVVLPRMSGRLESGAVRSSLIEAVVIYESTGSAELAADAFDRWLDSVAKTARAATMAMSHAMRLPLTV